MNFATLQGLTIPEGVVTQITDASGRVLWSAITATDEPMAIFEVAKQTNASYAGETQYTDNEFILLDIYPKRGGTVTVTYEGLTKTVTDTSGAETPNAIQVFFGRFNGETDSVETPASGRLTIEGAYRGYGTGSFGGFSNKTSGTYAPFVTSVIDFGNPVYIGSYMFSDCSNITPTVLPQNLTYIGMRAFSQCINLILYSLPNSLTYIGSYAFFNCSSLTSVTIPDSVTYLGDAAFSYCDSLTSVTIPDSVTSISSSAFQYCSSLTSVTIPDSVTSIGDSAFRYCTSLTLTSLPNDIKSIGDNAFFNCSLLLLSSLPKSITMIGNSAFYNCKSLSITTFPEGLETIGEGAFQMYVDNKENNTIAMYGKTVILPSTIKSIGADAFKNSGYNNYYMLGDNHYYFTYLGTVVMLSEIPPTIEDSTFGDQFYYTSNKKIPIIVPKGCGEAYKTADIWSRNASNITEAS